MQCVRFRPLAVDDARVDRMVYFGGTRVEPTLPDSL
jgi:hypothetical protein